MRATICSPGEFFTLPGESRDPECVSYVREKTSDCIYAHNQHIVHLMANAALIRLRLLESNDLNSPPPHTKAMIIFCFGLKLNKRLFFPILLHHSPTSLGGEKADRATKGQNLIQLIMNQTLQKVQKVRKRIYFLSKKKKKKEREKRRGKTKSGDTTDRRQRA